MKLSWPMVLRKTSLINAYIYMKVSGSKYIFLVLYVDNILLPVNDIDLLVELK